jgi:hypothetical protein
VKNCVSVESSPRSCVGLRRWSVTEAPR